MIAEKLRAAILQAAISGKLTEQRPDDGTAADLLSRIAEEKAALVKAGKLKKPKPLPPVTEDEQPFEIPDNWEWTRLGTVFTMQAGKNLPTGLIRSEGPFAVYGGNGIRGYVDHFNRDGHFPIIGRQGALCGNINIAHGRFYATEHAVVVETYSDTSYKWAAQFLEAANLNQYATATAQPGISVAKIGTATLPLPPVAEQERIVAKLDKLMPLIDQLAELEREREDLDRAFFTALEAAILQAAISGQLTDQRPDDGTAADLLARITKEKTALIKAGKLKKLKPLPPVAVNEQPFDIPGSWVWTRLGELFQLINGDRGKNYPAKSKLHSAGSYPFVSASNFDRNGLVAEGMLYLDAEQFDKLGSGKFENDDYLVCIRGSLGKYCCIRDGVGAIASSLVILRAFISDSNQLLAVYLGSPLMEAEIDNYDNGTAQRNLSAGNFARFLMPLPPLAEQERIAAKLDAVLPLVRQLQEASA
ncbi:MAG: restriction endonuclease subunit S [Bowdeniella nasicola]|nr:restriction endonuclease subunit S [Bowdeniella nasicola]